MVRIQHGTNLVKPFSLKRSPAPTFACRFCRSSPENTLHISMSKRWICTSIRADKIFRHYNCTTLSTDRTGLMLSSSSRKLTFPDAPSPKTTNLSWWSVGVSSSESDISLVSKQQWVVWTSSESLSHVDDSQRRLFVVTSNALLPVQNSRGLKTRWRSWLPGAASN